MRRNTIALVVVLAACSAPQSPAPAPAPVAAMAAPANQDARMQWWREARFGMFIHWGLYAIPAGAWEGKTDYGEWIRESAHIPVDVYERFRPQWNPTRFDADAWARMAADAGMKYLVLTSKHHDGFCLFDSRETDWDCMNTPFGRDICAELSAACARHGVTFCTYHSIMDWHHPDYLPRRAWEAADRPAAGADFERFERYLHAQVTEVVTKYHPAVMWFDGEWENTWTHARGQRLFELCRRLDPAMIVNNRVDVHRGGMGGFNGSSEAVGDFATPEQEIPATGMPGVDWESCMTMNRHWGWNAADTTWKSTQDLVRNLIDTASKGGNYLLNVGPRADGTLPPLAVERLAGIGAWMRQNGEAIYGTTASVFDALPWGRCTVRQNGDTTRLYFHVFDWPADGRLVLPAFGNEVAGGAFLLADPQRLVRFDQSAGSYDTDMALRLPDGPRDPIATVVVLDIKGAPIVHRSPTITAESQQFVRGVDVTLATATVGGEVRYTTDGKEPGRKSRRADGVLHLTESCTVRAVTVLDGKEVADEVTATFTKVEPSPAVQPLASRPGLACARASGVDWQRIPDDRAGVAFAPIEPAPAVALPKAIGEHVALQFQGFVAVPDDELYRFALASDDGSRLWIDGELVVDNDGLHSAETRTGARALAKGLHPIEIVWFNATGGAELGLKWAAPGRAFEPVPAAALRH